MGLCFSSTELALFKANLQREVCSLVLSLHVEMWGGERGMCIYVCESEDVVNNSNETRAKVWLVFVSLPYVISYFQTAHHRGRKENKEEESYLGKEK